MKTNKFIKLFSNANLSPERGAFLSDKSYKFDTVYFVSKFILSHLDKNKDFNIKLYKDECIYYVEQIFSLKSNSSVSINYLREILNLLVFSNILVKKSQDNYKVIKYSELKYISKKMENSYIFLFIATYITFSNEGILDIYFKFIKANGNKEKAFYLNQLAEIIAKKSKRVSDPNSVWGKLVVKYPLMVLGLFYNQKAISKSLNIADEYISVKSLSMNVSGTKSNNIKKNNEYLFLFDMNYVKRKLKKYEIKDDKH
ncbi:MAG: hypothetical protein ACI4T1_01465 [Christensenellales bacterium]